MVVKTNWPGASAREVEQQVTDKIERKLQEVPNVDWVRSYSQARRVAGVLRAQGLGAAVAGARDLRTRCARRSATSATRCRRASRGRSSTTSSATPTPTSTRSPATASAIASSRSSATRVRAELLRVPGVAKVDFIGEQDEKIFIELSNSKLATLGVEPAQIIADARRAERGGGVRRVRHRPPTASTCGPPARSTRVDAIRDIAIRANNRVFRLGDIAKVTRGYVDPPQQKMRWQGSEALGIGVTMVAGRRRHRARRTTSTREIARHRSRRCRSASRSTQVAEHAARGAALGQPVRALARRGGADRARRVAREPRACAPASSSRCRFRWCSRSRSCSCGWLDIGLHKISLGALILSLGLLVDDAIIAVEMMAIKMEQGFDRVPRGELRLHEHGVPDADRHARHRRRLPADRHRAEQHRRVHALDLPGLGDRADRVVGGRGRRDPVPRLQDAAGRHEGSGAVAARATVGARHAAQPPPPVHVVASPIDDAVYRTPFYRALARARSRGASAIAGRCSVATLAALRRRARRCSASCRSSSFPRRRAPSCWSTCGCPKAARSPRRWRRRRSSRRSSTRSRASRATSRYVGSGSRASTCRSTSSCTQSNFAQFVLVAKSNEERETRARAPARAVRRRLSGAARARVAARERSAGRLSRAVPRVRRGHRDGARDRAARSREVMRTRSRDVARCSSTGTSRRR